MKFLRALALSALSAAFGAIAAPPANYYTKAENKNQRSLLEALSSIISNHTTLSYNSLNDYYPKTDAYPDGTLWDIYSTKHWKPSEKCGNYKNVGDCYNKEHSFPKSWFDGSSPMYSDIMHLYPTDGKVNGQRSNYPFGECAGGTNLGSNGSVRALGRLGTSTFSGYSGKVFEPDDEYKGDLARTYFYMAACYYSRTASWHSDMLAGNNFPLFKPWAITLLLKWHRQDPVSARETTRNEEIYKVQKNRNPFIDHPELAEYIWG
ncbi:MAG: endonuclease, partial [Muribaculaceae bacterium]|nr:endonuclease [Muribaculaceae bacterium]